MARRCGRARPAPRVSGLDPRSPGPQPGAVSATDDLVLRALAWGLKKETTRSELAWWLRRELGAEEAEARWPALVRGLREGGHWAPDVDASSHALRVTRERGASTYRQAARDRRRIEVRPRLRSTILAAVGGALIATLLVFSVVLEKWGPLVQGLIFGSPLLVASVFRVRRALRPDHVEIERGLLRVRRGGAVRVELPCEEVAYVSVLDVGSAEAEGLLGGAARRARRSGAQLVVAIRAGSLDPVLLTDFVDGATARATCAAIEDALELVPRSPMPRVRVDPGEEGEVAEVEERGENGARGRRSEAGP